MKSALAQTSSTFPLSTRNVLKTLSSPQMISFLSSESSSVKTGRQFFDFDAHVAARFFQQILVRMRQQHDRFFRMIDDFVGEIRLIVEDQRDVVFAGNVFGGDDGELVPGNVAFERDVLDSPARQPGCAPSRRAACPGNVRCHRRTAPAPVTFLRPSLRGTDLPMGWLLFATNVYQMRLIHNQSSGTERLRQIFLASWFETSVWRGTASTAPVLGFIHSECAAPSRFR